MANYWLLLRHHLQRQLRTPQQLLGLLLFGLLLIVLVNFTQLPSSSFWLIYYFTLTLLLQRQGAEAGAAGWQQAYLLQGVAAETIFLAQATALWLQSTLLGASLLACMSWLQPASSNYWYLLSIIAVSGIGLSLLGSFFSGLLAIAGGLHFLPLLFYPLSLPLLISSIQLATSMLEQGMAAWLSSGGLLLMSAVLFYTAITSMLVYWMIEEW